jgi:DNA-binding protein Fis
MQKHYFEAVLKAAKGKISGTDGAAALSGMHPNTLRSKLDKLGVTFKAVKPEL